MNIFAICPCCSTTMLHHLGNHREYWFCRHCWQEMPDLEAVKQNNYYRQHQIVNLSIGLLKLNKSVSVLRSKENLGLLAS